MHGSLYHNRKYGIFLCQPEHRISIGFHFYPEIGFEQFRFVNIAICSDSLLISIYCLLYIDME